MNKMFEMQLTHLLECACSGLLPPYKKMINDPLVPLAAITVSLCDCNVIRVCNLTTHRKFLTTFPNLQYWLSWFPMRKLRDIISYICCNPIISLSPSRKDWFDLRTMMSGFPKTQGSKKKAVFTERDLANLVASQLFNQILAPFLKELTASPLMSRDMLDKIPGLFSHLGVGITKPGAKIAEDVEGLKSEMNELKETVKAQQKKIDQLSKPKRAKKS